MPAHLQRDFVGYGRNPPHPRWPNDARLALNIVINYEEGAEPAVPDGDERSESSLTDGDGVGLPGRDLAAESLFEYGSRVGFWRVLRLLRERDLPATVFACALALERNPQACDAIRDSGFDICCHGWRWVKHGLLPEAEERNQIARACRSIAITIGERPLGWYCRYGPSLNTRRLLVEHGGFLYDSDAYNDELPYWVRVAGQDHLVVPYGLTHNDVKFVRGGMVTGAEYFEFLRGAVDLLYREGATQPKMLSVGLHPRLTGHPGRAVGLERFLDFVCGHSGIWICRRIDIARHWRDKHPPPQ